MKILQDILALLKAFGLQVSANLLAIAVILIPIALTVGAFLYMRYKKQREGAAMPVSSSGPMSLGTQLRAYQLRSAWLRFTRQLPSDYRRSILNFEQFVVMGPAASGKSRLIDTHTDWRRKANEFLGSQPLDPDLPVYLASNAVVTELPAAVLGDHGAKAHAALRHLWKPLFRDRTPTMVVVIDPMQLRESSPEAIKELGETLRGKVNVVSSIRRRPIEVRVVLTHLDALEGYADFAAFCRTSDIAVRIPVTGGAEHDVTAQLEAWLDGMRGHLPRALVALDSSAFRRVVAFLRRAPELIAPVAQLLAPLLAKEALSPDPICGGVYFGADTPGVANPLQRAIEAGPGPDPRRRHFIAAAAAAAAIFLYLGIAYAQQRAVHREAEQALESYAPHRQGEETEASARDAITAFTYRRSDWLLHHPDYFASARTKMRQRFSDRVRDDLLVPKLQHILEKGTSKDAVPLPMRSSLYFLALIHSDHLDRMRILDPRRLQIWSLMTGLKPELIKDYLVDVDVPYAHEVQFDLGQGQLDARDSAAYWVAFFHTIKETVADGLVSPDELAVLRGRAGALTEALDRFDNDDVTKEILDRLDDAAGAAEVQAKPAEMQRLKRAYSPKYSEFLNNISSSDVWGQRDQLRDILRAVNASTIESTDTPLLHTLADRVALLYTPVVNPHDEPEVKVHLVGQEYVFDHKKWAALLRDSQAAETIAHFIHTHDASTSIFFGPDADDLPALVWNPTNDGSSIFMGKGTIEGRYTRSAFDKYVREPVLKAADLDKVPAERKQRLDEFVRDHLRRYATEYRRQLLRFFQSYKLSAPSAEALRVALAQMVSDVSPFNDFLVAVDRQTNLDLASPSLEPMRDAVGDFASWHDVVAGSTGSPELTKYKAMIGQLLADLGPPAAGGTSPLAAPAPPVAATTPQGLDLEKELSPAGQRILSSLRGDKGSYGAMIGEWVRSVKLTELQQQPFLAPLYQLTAIGRAEIQGILTRVWTRDMLPDVVRMAERFPFNRDSDEDAVPSQVIALFHPQTGRFFDLFRRYIEPLSEPLDTGGYRERRSIHGGLTFPSGMLAVVNQVDALARRLWDSTGKPLPLVETVSTTAFEHGSDPRMALTLVYMNVGDVSLFNFNQRPTEKTIHFDWTKESTSQVGVQLTDLDSMENIFPEPIVVDGAFWSFFRLIKKATLEPVKFPPNAQLYVWKVKNRRDRSDMTRARFVITGDPWEPFALDKVIRGGTNEPRASVN